MTAQTEDRNTPERPGVDFSDPAAAAKKFFVGAIVMLDASGNATPGATATGLTPRGVCQDQVDNSAGAAGDVEVPSKKGTFRFVNDGTVARVDIGGTAYVVDDQTVADNDGTSTRSALGEIVDVDSVGVFVRID